MKRFFKKMAITIEHIWTFTQSQLGQIQVR
jgi:hypothetical protein